MDTSHHLHLVTSDEGKQVSTPPAQNSNLGPDRRQQHSTSSTRVLQGAIEALRPRPRFFFRSCLEVFSCIHSSSTATTITTYCLEPNPSRMSACVVFGFMPPSRRVGRNAFSVSRLAGTWRRCMHPNNRLTCTKPKAMGFPFLVRCTQKHAQPTARA